MISVNITALTGLTRLFLPAMLDGGHGRILNVASVTGFLPGPLLSVYFSSKHYVLAFSESLIEELHGSGVTITALCPPPASSSPEWPRSPRQNTWPPRRSRRPRSLVMATR